MRPPFSSANDGDDDGDGIALACDPDLLAKKEVLLVTGFDLATSNALIIRNGGLGNDAFSASSSSNGLVMTRDNFNAVWATQGVNVAGIAASGYREVDIVFDATTATGETNGTYCALGKATSEYPQLYARSRPEADKALQNILRAFASKSSAPASCAHPRTTHSCRRPRARTPQEA